MTILARFQNRHVKILDVFTTGDGRKLAIVQALEGQPFTNWTHGGWAASDTTTLRADLLQDVAAESRPAGNLLTLALANAKSQWYAGESVWLWRKNGGAAPTGAFLKEEGGIVTLNLTGFAKSLRMFCIDLKAGEWQQARNLEANYHLWAAQAKAHEGRTKGAWRR